MNTNELIATSLALSSNRRNGRNTAIATLQQITRATAWDIQAIAAASYSAESVGYSIVGWPGDVRRQLGLSGPIYAPIAATSFLRHRDPALPAHATPQSDPQYRLPQGVIGAQCELAFVFGAPVSAPAHADGARRQIIDALSAIHPAIGLLGRRARPRGDADDAAIADFGLHVATCVGAPASPHALAADVALTARIDGNEVLAPGYRTAPFDPIAPLVWLAHELVRLGGCLNAGDIVTCGSLTPILQVLPGQVLDLTVAGVGCVRSAFV